VRVLQKLLSKVIAGLNDAIKLIFCKMGPDAPGPIFIEKVAYFFFDQPVNQLKKKPLINFGRFLSL
jgi:hypothetical protein